MACSPTPTATLFGTTTELSVTTLYSDATSTLPSTVTTILAEKCVAAGNGSACVSSSATGQVSTILGECPAIERIERVSDSDLLYFALQAGRRLFASLL